jgi:hypothetical protein
MSPSILDKKETLARGLAAGQKAAAAMATGLKGA